MVWATILPSSIRRASAHAGGRRRDRGACRLGWATCDWSHASSTWEVQ